jgi:hypothetical protein
MEKSETKTSTANNIKEAATPVREEDLSDGRTGKFLTESQHQELELALLKLQLSAKSKVEYQWRIKTLERDLEIEQLRMKEKTFQFKEQMRSLRQKLLEHDAVETQQRESNESLMVSMLKEHGISEGRLGYNPDTLEIIL